MRCLLVRDGYFECLKFKTPRSHIFHLKSSLQIFYTNYKAIFTLSNHNKNAGHPHLYEHLPNQVTRHARKWIPKRTQIFSTRFYNMSLIMFPGWFCDLWLRGLACSSNGLGSQSALQYKKALGSFSGCFLARSLLVLVPFKSASPCTLLFHWKNQSYSFPVSVRFIKVQLSLWKLLFGEYGNWDRSNVEC